MASFKFDFPGLFEELQHEIGARSDISSVYMMSLTNKSMYKLFKQPQLVSERVELTKGHFLSDFQSHRKVLSSKQRALILAIISLDAKEQFDFLFDDCQWPLNMDGVKDIALSLIQNGLILRSSSLLLPYMTFKARVDHMRVRCRQTECTIQPHELALAMGRSDSRSVVRHINQHYELILPKLVENHVSYLRGLLVHDNIEMFRECSLTQMSIGYPLNTENIEFVKDFGRFRALACLDYYIDVFVKSYWDVYYMLRVILRWMAEEKISLAHAMMICDVQCAHMPNAFNIHYGFRREWYYNDILYDHAIPLTIHILQEHPLARGSSTDLPEFQQSLINHVHIPLDFETYSQQWYAVAEPYLGNDFKQAYQSYRAARVQIWGQ